MQLVMLLINWKAQSPLSWRLSSGEKLTDGYKAQLNVFLCHLLWILVHISVPVKVVTIETMIYLKEWIDVYVWFALKPALLLELLLELLRTNLTREFNSPVA